MEPVIRIRDLSKLYRLGTIGTGTLSNDLKRWWHLARGKEDPFTKVGETNIRSQKGSSDFVWAIKDINLDVLPGEILGIIGKNGAGKSTLLKILSKVTGPTAGTIEFNGRIGSLLEVGTGFHPELSGRENVFLNGAILGMSKQEIRSKLDEIIEFSGCERYIDTPVKRYSSGMKVRLGFAVAAHLEPEILIVDEVLAVGDADFQRKAIGKMKSVSQEDGRTVLFVSHNMSSIEALCTSAVLIEDGTIANKGKPPEIINEYRNHRVNEKLTLGQARKRGFPKQASIDSITVKDLDALQMGRMLVLDLEVSKSVEITRPLYFRGTIFSGDERPVGSFFPKSQCVFDSRNVSKCRIVVNDLQLVPGFYYIRLTLGTGGVSEGRANHDFIMGYPRFEVKPRAITDDNYVQWTSNIHGQVRFANTHLDPI